MINLDIYLKKKTTLAAILFAAVLLFTAIPLYISTQSEASIPKQSTNSAVIDINSLHITMNTVRPNIQSLTADSENRLAVRVLVTNPDGEPIQGAEVQLKASIDNEARADKENKAVAENKAVTDNTAVSIVDATAANNKSDINKAIAHPGTTSKSTNIGAFYPATGLTDSNGIFLTEYAPPASISGISRTKLSSNLIGTDKISSIDIDLVPVPVVLVHGYQASPDIFSGITAYLKTKGFNPMCLDYSSEKGVIVSAEALSAYLDKVKSEMVSSGTQVNRFDLIAHSMGGLVARYYTCSSGYSSKEDIRKLIFLSVPQRGSPFASIGLKYYDNQGIRDLLTDSTLYTKLLPAMTNGGLNPSIQTGSIMGRYDEVVSTESASLSEWNIKTELFDVGDSNFTIDKLLSGEILQAANHKLILYNRKVYQRVEQMLLTDLPFPSSK